MTRFLPTLTSSTLFALSCFLLGKGRGSALRLDQLLEIATTVQNEDSTHHSQPEKKTNKQIEDEMEPVSKILTIFLTHRRG